MCDYIKIARVAIVCVCVVMLLSALWVSHRFCKRRGINLNTVSGLLEMYRRIFKFESKKFSILMFVAMYGGALMVLGGAKLTTWGEEQGCTFPANPKFVVPG